MSIGSPIGSPLAASNSRIVPSQLPVAMTVPSGLHATADVASSPVSIGSPTGTPPAASKKRTVPSPLPVGDDRPIRTPGHRRRGVVAGIDRVADRHAGRRRRTTAPSHPRCRSAMTDPSGLHATAHVASAPVTIGSPTGRRWRRRTTAPSHPRCRSRRLTHPDSTPPPTWSRRRYQPGRR